ncbi:MAG: hypothetical protein LBU89_03345 [Fibromonadaceae bacterium]|jgi:hypothetical protein|nr:hypothetical protein [Fibromonadaceae bacterium]
MLKSHKNGMLALLDTMSKMATLLPKLEDPTEQTQDFLAACECLRENLDGENAPESLALLQEIETCVGARRTLSLQELIKKLESKFKSEVKTKLEVLFLPYKASMWDSLESIYLAAREDSNCEVFVMPIPYYDKKDNKFTDMHWEINYPKNIPLIDYKKYDFAERQPDIIFIHNPYDDCNVVTSVHPDFYSEKLRNLTKCLVYVPYFVGDGINVKDHFCTLPACIYAHKVIVQTEAVREIYVREYRKIRPPDGTSKFLALGSPKLDKAITAKREDYEIPEAWQKLIGDKKIIFYNTSIGTLLENTIENNRPSNKYLQKARSVFEFFKNHKDAVLLWRPHPLLESTIKAMRPWLEQEYAEIVHKFKTENYGIYDDTEDLSRAVALSDIHYGDGSSVARLFEAAGKPVLPQLFAPPPIYGLYADENSVWFMDYFNTLYRYDKQKKETECVWATSRQKWGKDLHIAEHNEKLYFAPYRNNEISVFDIKKQNFEKIALKDDDKIDHKFQNLTRFRNFIYFIPRSFPTIMRLNTDTNELEYFSEWGNEVAKLQVLKLQHEAWKDLKFFGFCIVDAEIALVTHRANAVMFFNMETGGYEIKSIGNKNEQHYSICFDGQNYYMTSYYEGYIVKWNKQSNETSKIELPSFSRKNNLGANFLTQYANDHIWLFPIAANNAYKINPNTNEITELPELIEYFGDKDLAWHYNFISAEGSFIYASTLNKGIVEYNTNTRELNFIKNDSNEEIALLWLANRKSEVAERENAGKKIWEKIRGN